MTLSEFAIACGASPKWVQNAGRLLGRSLRYTAAEARHMGLVKRLQADLGVSLETADGFAAEALAGGNGGRVVVGSGRIARITIDVERYLSDFAVRLARAVSHHEPRRRGRRRRQGGSAIARARRHGLDIDLLRASLRVTPEERLRRLDENADFVRALRERRR